MLRPRTITAPVACQNDRVAEHQTGITHSVQSEIIRRLDSMSTLTSIFNVEHTAIRTLLESTSIRNQFDLPICSMKANIRSANCKRHRRRLDIVSMNQVRLGSQLGFAVSRTSPNSDRKLLTCCICYQVMGYRPCRAPADGRVGRAAIQR